MIGDRTIIVFDYRGAGASEPDTNVIRSQDIDTTTIWTRTA